MGNSKGAGWIFILVIVAAACWGYWYYFGLTVKEPPLGKQVLAQIDEMNGGTAAQLPIPLIIGKTILRTLEMDSVTTALKAAGFTEEAPPAGMNDVSDFGLGIKTTYKMFSRDSDGLMAHIMTMSSKPMTMTTVSFSSEDAIDSLLATMPDLGVPDFDEPDVMGKSKPPKTGVLGMGPLFIGMPEARVRRAVDKIPHNTRTDPMSMLSDPSVAGAISPSDAAGLAASMSNYLGNCTQISRGKYTYMLQYGNKRLASITVADMGSLFKSNLLPNKAKEDVLKMMFDKDK